MVITIMFSLIVIALGLLLFSLFVIFGPLILIIPANEIKKKYQQVLAIISIIILYPLISGLFAFFLLLIVLLYPCLRSTYHHGIYDPFDSALANLTFAHISCMKWIWSEWLNFNKKNIKNKFQTIDIINFIIDYVLCI